MHELRAHENGTEAVDLVARLKDCVQFDGRKVLYSWIGGTRRDWRGQGHFRALTEECEAWAHASGFHEVVVKTKNRFYDMRGTLDQLEFDVVKYEIHPTDNRESKVYLSKRLTSDVVKAHTSTRTVVLLPTDHHTIRIQLCRFHVRYVSLVSMIRCASAASRSGNVRVNHRRHRALLEQRPHLAP